MIFFGNDVTGVENKAYLVIRSISIIKIQPPFPIRRNLFPPPS